MQHHRTGESSTIPFRNDRYFCTNGVWYFEVRGGQQKGPYLNKQEMENELSVYIKEQQALKQAGRF